MRIYINDFEKHLSETLNVKKNQMKVVEKLMNVMQRLIKAKDVGPVKIKFKRRFDNDDLDYVPSAINELLKYLYDHFTELFMHQGEMKPMMNIEVEKVLHILDEIPDELLERCTRPPEKVTRDQETQSAMTLNMNRNLGKTELYDAYILAYPDARVKVKKVPKNNLFKAVTLFLKKKKEKINPTSEGNSHKLITTIIEEKLKADIDCEKNGKDAKLLWNFVLENLTMKFGLKTIAVRNILSLKESLIAATKQYKDHDKFRTPYSQIMLGILGMEGSEKTFEHDDVTLIIRSRALFIEAQEAFKKIINARSNLDIKDFVLNDLYTGGSCSSLELIETFTLWCKSNKRIMHQVLPRLLPDIPEKALGKLDATKQFYLDFSLMRINHKAARMGKDMASFFKTLASNESETINPKNLLEVLRDKYNIHFNADQTEHLIEYLDQDESGDVDLDEFMAKVNYPNYTSTYHKYLTTYQTFAEVLLDVWEEEKKLAFAHFLSKFHEFDANQDGVLVFEEFENLINNLQKNMSKNDISTLFSETLEMDEDSPDMDKMNPEWFCKMAFEHKLGGYGKVFLNSDLNMKELKRRTSVIKD